MSVASGTFVRSMLKVVTSNNTAIFRELRAPAFQPIELQQVVVISGTEALTRIRKLRPDLVVLDVDLPELSGYDVCRTIKDDPDPELAATRIILVITGSPDRQDIERLNGSGCDDLLTIPTPTEDLYAHAARLLDLPQRQRSRVLAQVVLPAGSPVPIIRGEAIEIALDAVTVKVEHIVAPATEVKVRLGRAGAGVGVVVRGTVVGCETARKGAEMRLRVKLTGLRPDDERALADLALWQVVDRPEGLLIIIRGDITERTAFDSLLDQIRGAHKLSFDLHAVRYLNSSGILRWSQFLDQLEPEVDYEFVRCAPAFVAQFGLVSSARGRGRIVSFMAPYYCEMCDREIEQMLRTDELQFPDGKGPATPAFDCPSCGGPLLLDDIPERFFAFARRQD